MITVACKKSNGADTKKGALGYCSHAEGYETTASGTSSHAEGDHTTASGSYSHAEGTYNVKDTHAIHSVGIGNSVVSKNAEYIYIGTDAFDGIDVSNPKHGYKYLIGVGGYDGVSTDNSKYKSVQEVIAELTEKTAEIGKSYFEVRFAGEGTITINGESTSLEKRQLFRYEGTPTSLKIEGSHLAWLDVSNLDTSKITSMNGLFSKCDSSAYGSTLNVSGWDVSNVTDMTDMFSACDVLPSLDVSSWNVSKLVKADFMFTGCYKLSTVDFSRWDTSSLESFVGFSQGVGFKTIVFGENFGKMTDKFTSLDISQISTWKDDSVKSLLNLYDRKANGMGVVTIKLHANTKAVLGEDGIAQLTAKGYTIA